jgi:hypothetical protein
VRFILGKVALEHLVNKYFSFHLLPTLNDSSN